MLAGVAKPKDFKDFNFSEPRLFGPCPGLRLFDAYQRASLSWCIATLGVAKCSGGASLARGVRHQRLLGLRCLVDGSWRSSVAPTFAPIHVSCLREMPAFVALISWDSDCQTLWSVLDAALRRANDLSYAYWALNGSTDEFMTRINALVDSRLVTSRDCTPFRRQGGSRGDLWPFAAGESIGRLWAR